MIIPIRMRWCDYEKKIDSAKVKSFPKKVQKYCFGKLLIENRENRLMRMAMQ